MECSKCGAPAELAKLFDVISGEGIVKVCQRCLSYENSPIIRKPTEDQFASINKSEPIYQRLSSAAGLNADKHRANLEIIKKEDVVKKQEVTLRDLIDKKFDKFVKQEAKKKRTDLIDNFHWVIMRSRRFKQMSVLQLAKEVGETEKAIKMAEQGVLPEDNYNLAIKLEEILGIRILKPEISEQIARAKKQLGFDKFSAKTLTIADLQKMKEESATPVVEEQKIPYWRRFLNKLTNKKEKPESPIVLMEEKNEEPNEMDFEETKEKNIEFSDTSFEMSEEVSEEEKKKTELTQKDIDDIIFGRR
jgi:ribosome-binding protein aMBF1 (putative translation factor)